LGAPTPRNLKGAKKKGGSRNCSSCFKHESARWKREVGNRGQAGRTPGGEGGVRRHMERDEHDRRGEIMGQVNLTAGKRKHSEVAQKRNIKKPHGRPWAAQRNAEREGDR